MTDASVPITQSAVERFTEQYLESVGCSIEKQGDRWDASVPEQSNTDLPEAPFTLYCGEGLEEDAADANLLTPESSFFQQILTKATERVPTGKITINSDDTQIEPPVWIVESRVSVNDVAFTPYYDRTAVVILFRISIETVSEYQTELLQAFALDARSKDSLPTLEETFLEVTSLDSNLIEDGSLEIERAEIRRLINDTQDRAVERIQPRIDEIHQEASRAAESEIEEYRRMQQQRVDELEEQLSALSRRIDESSESVQNSSDQDERVQSLKKRRELKAEYEEIESELTKIQQRRDSGFPETQRDIRDRHALEVIVTPLTITQVDYERGELEMKLAEKSTQRSLTVGYGSGIGVTEEVACDVCECTLTRENPLQSIGNGLQCEKCTTRK